MSPPDEAHLQSLHTAYFTEMQAQLSGGVLNNPSLYGKIDFVKNSHLKAGFLKQGLLSVHENTFAHTKLIITCCCSWAFHVGASYWWIFISNAVWRIYEKMSLFLPCVMLGGGGKHSLDFWMIFGLINPPFNSVEPPTELWKQGVGVAGGKQL